MNDETEFKTIVFSIAPHLFDALDHLAGKLLVRPAEAARQILEKALLARLPEHAA